MDDNLFKKIKKSNEIYQDYPLPAKAYSDFKKYSDKLDNPKKHNFYNIGSLLLLLLLVTSNLIWFNFYQKSQDLLSSVEGQIETHNSHSENKTGDLLILEKSTSSNSSRISVKEPQSHIQQITRQYDLIDRLKDTDGSASKTKLSERIGKQKNELLGISDDNNSGFLQTLTYETQIKPTLTYSKQLANEFQSNNESDSQTHYLNTTRTLISSPLLIATTTRFPLYSRPELNLEIKSVKIPQINSSILSTLENQKISVFFNLGFGNKLSGKPCADCKSVNYNFGVSKTLNQKLKIKTSFLSINQVGEFQDKMIEKNPFVSPEEPDGFFLHEIEYNLNRVGLQFGLEYYLLRFKNLRSFIGISSYWSQNYYSKVSFQFRNQNSRTFIEAADIQIFTNSLSPRIGLELLICDNFELNFHGSYLINLNKSSNDLFNSNIGLNYYF